MPTTPTHSTARRTRRLLCGAVVAASLLSIGAHTTNAGAAGLSFGGKVDNFSDPSNAEGGIRCDQNHGIPHGSTCTWVSVQAYHNGGHEQAPATGTIKHVKLVSCVAGSFVLQFAKASPSAHTAQVVRNGPTINYKADPRQIDNDPNTFCGGDGGDQFIVQTFAVNVHVNKGEYIAIKAAKGGPFYCSGGSGLLLFAPPLATGGATKHANATASCNLMVQLNYT
jgi:hypothetical protein